MKAKYSVQRRRFLILALFSGLIGWQTTTSNPVFAQEISALYSGTWKGYFINQKGTRYPVTWSLRAKNGKVSGGANVPDSTYDKTPTISGTYTGANAILQTSSGFKNSVTMLVTKDGEYWLKGGVTGRNTGRLELKRQ